MEEELAALPPLLQRPECILRGVFFYQRGVCMSNLWSQIQGNLTFVLVCAAIVVGLVLLAKLAERFMPEKRKILRTI